jgi:hypothetical protein
VPEDCPVVEPTLTSALGMVHVLERQEDEDR